MTRKDFGGREGNGWVSERVGRRERSDWECIWERARGKERIRKGERRDRDGARQRKKRYKEKGKIETREGHKTGKKGTE